MCTFPIGGRCAVTICIAAISNWTDGKTEEIVTASDHMVTTGDHTADNVIRKIEPIHAHWHAMFATDVPTRFVHVDSGRVCPSLVRVGNAGSEPVTPGVARDGTVPWRNLPH